MKTNYRYFITGGIVSLLFSVNAQTASTIGQTTGDPSGIAVDATGNVYIAERAPTPRITKINQTTGQSSVFSNSGIMDPLHIAVGSDNKLYVADYAGGKILTIPSAGGPATPYETGATQPVGIVFDMDTLYYIEYSSQMIFKVLPGGGSVGGSNVIQISDSAFWMGPNARGTGLTLLSDGNLFVTAALHYSHYVVNKSTGSIITEIYSDESIVFNATLLSDGNIYMPGYNTNKIYKWNDTQSDSYSFFGNGSPNSVDGSDTIAAFHGPYYIAKDQNDNLYVSDSDSKKIRKITNAIATLTEHKQGIVSISPNPASSLINILLDREDTLTILSSEGRIIAKLSGASAYAFDVSELNNGFYFIKSENSGTQRFIKH